MSFAPESESRVPESLIRPEALWRAPLGFTSPLWGVFAGAAMGASAWWWMTRWAQPKNLEAMLGAAEAVAEAEVDQVAALASPAAAAIDSVDEVLMDSGPAALAAALDAALDFPPVGGEAAPFSPVLEALEPEVVEAAAVEATHLELAAAEPAVVDPAPGEPVSAEPAPAKAIAEPASAPKARRKAAAPTVADTAD